MTNYYQWISKEKQINQETDCATLPLDTHTNTYHYRISVIQLNLLKSS